MVQQPGKLQMIISNNNTTYQAQEAALEAGATEEAQAAAEEAQAAVEAQGAETMRAKTTELGTNNPWSAASP